MSALRRPTTLLAVPLLALGLATAAAPTATAAGSSLGWGGHTNGKIPASALCAIPWDRTDSLRCDATRKLTSLNTAYKARFGANLCINDAYRSYTKQVALYKKYGSPRAAKPGTSTHGWGLAVDLGCGVGAYSGARYKWMASVGRKYGWAQPTWAVAKGSNPEPWHWQFFGTALPTPPPPARKPPAPKPPAPKPPAPKPPAPPAPAVTTGSLSVTGTWPRTATFTLRVKSTGKAVAGARVSIDTRDLGSTQFRTVRTATTDSAGRVAWTQAPETPTVVRFTFAGSSTAKPATGTTTLTTVTRLRSRLTDGRRHPLVVGRLTTPAGDRLDGRTVTLQRRVDGSSTWTTEDTLETNDDGWVWARVDRDVDSTYRFVFAGADGYVGSVGDEVEVSESGR
ncbi:M15 family metallopeptidase [Phycicoccus jejuensis]|uniref:M15 family metallopeptidase n=1 Tax=Phycicoccus jejuensis TaxID=367299 RepID=UPI003850866C